MLPVIVLAVLALASFFVWIARKLDAVMLRNVTSAFQIIVSYSQVIGSTNSNYNIPWPPKMAAFMAGAKLALLDFFQVTSFDCWQRLNFLDTFWITMGVTFGILCLVPIFHRYTPHILRCITGANDPALRRVVRNLAFKVVAMYMAVLYPAITLKSLSLWNCQTIGDTEYLVLDVSQRCDGDRYARASLFNVFFVVVVVVGWPAFLIVYLRRIASADRHADTSVADRIGFLYEPYRREFMWWDVLETMRKLYLVTVVAFFQSGSIVQIVLSILVSVVALAYHTKARPFNELGLNLLQGANLGLVWLTFQAGLMLQYNGAVTETTATVTTTGLIAVCFPGVLFFV
jgi:hypothetical protein